MIPTIAKYGSQRRRFFTQAATVLLVPNVLAACGSGTGTEPPQSVFGIKSSQLKSVLAKARGNGVGIAGALISDEAIVLEVDGVLSNGQPALMRTDNWLHLGSNSKSMTAMAVAVQVENGKLRWDDTLEKLFPELASTMLPQYKGKTLLEVLSFRASFMPLLQFAEFADVPISKETLPEQRLEFVAWLLSQPPVNNQGTKTIYSNANYIVAGAIAERASGKPFEQTFQETVLAPLDLRGRFGLPQTVGADQPAAHAQFSPGQFTAISPNDPLVTNVPSYLNSAGLLSMPLPDYARYAQLQLRALQGKPTLLKAETFKVLHTALGTQEGSDAGLSPGWLVSGPAGKQEYEFVGSIDVMSAYIKLVPSNNRAVVVLINFDATDRLDAVLVDSANAILALRPSN